MGFLPWLKAHRERKRGAASRNAANEFLMESSPTQLSNSSTHNHGLPPNSLLIDSADHNGESSVPNYGLLRTESSQPRGISSVTNRYLPTSDLPDESSPTDGVSSAPVHGRPWTGTSDLVMKPSPPHGDSPVCVNHLLQQISTTGYQPVKNNHCNNLNEISSSSNDPTPVVTGADYLLHKEAPLFDNAETTIADHDHQPHLCDAFACNDNASSGLNHSIDEQQLPTSPNVNKVDNLDRHLPRHHHHLKASSTSSPIYEALDLFETSNDELLASVDDADCGAPIEVNEADAVDDRQLADGSRIHFQEGVDREK